MAAVMAALNPLMGTRAKSELAGVNTLETIWFSAAVLVSVTQTKLEFCSATEIFYMSVEQKRPRSAPSTENLVSKRARGWQQTQEEIDLTLDSPRFTAPAARPDPLGSYYGRLGADSARQQPRRQQASARPPTCSPEVVILEDHPPPRQNRWRRAAAVPDTQQAAHSSRWQPAAAAAAGAGARAAAATAEAAATEELEEQVDVALARRLQEEEDARLAAEEQRVMERMEELEAQEAAAEGPFAGFGGSLLGAAWPFQRRRFLPPAAPVLAAGGPAARTRGQRSGGRRSRWQAFGAHHLAGLPLPGALGGPHGWDAEPPSSRVALRAIRGAQHSNLPPHMLFRELGEEDYELLLQLDEGVENRKGASKAVIESLETVRIPRAGAGAGSGGPGTQHDDCAVCLEACRPGDVLRKLPCGHSYHQPCIDRWLSTKAACPICQQPVS